MKENPPFARPRSDAHERLAGSLPQSAQGQSAYIGARSHPFVANLIDDAGNPGTGEPPIFYTVDEIALILRVSTKTVRRRIDRQIIRKVPTEGRTVRVSSVELQRLASGEPFRLPLATDE